MIERILKIKHVGKFLGSFRSSDWDGSLKRNNIIYAPNGSGKTTLSLIFESLNSPPNLLDRKITFKEQLDEKNPDQTVSLKIDGKIFDCTNGVWNKKYENIEVFGVHFIENNLFSGSKQLGSTKLNLFALISGEEGRKQREKLANVKLKADQFKEAVRPFRRLMKEDKSKATYCREEIRKIHVSYQSARDDRHVTFAEIGKYSQNNFASFITNVNIHLAKFSHTMRLGKISSDLETASTFSLEVGKSKIVFDSVNGSYQFQYALSEGDKNALAISIFLAKVSLIVDPQKYVIVFDDPLSSFDSARRALTVRELCRLSKTFGQLIVLTHDSVFAADLERQLFNDAISLEINASSGRSVISYRSHQAENITPYFRDIQTVKDFLVNGASTEGHRREIVRCFRPILEAVIRFKYFDIFSKSQWLGNFIDMVRDAEDGDDLHHLKSPELFDDLCAINDYTKGYHHSSPDLAEENLDNEEIRIMAEKTLKMIRKI